MDIFEALRNHPGVDIETHTVFSPDGQVLVTTINAPDLNSSVTILLDKNANTVDQAAFLAILFTVKAADVITETKANGAVIKTHLSPPEE